MLKLEHVRKRFFTGLFPYGKSWLCDRADWSEWGRKEYDF